MQRSLSRPDIRGKSSRPLLRLRRLFGKGLGGHLAQIIWKDKSDLINVALHLVLYTILYTHCEKDVENNFVLYQRGQYLMTKLKHVNCVTHDTPQSAPPPLIDTVSNSVGFCLGHQVSSTCAAAVAAQNGDES